MPTIITPTKSVHRYGETALPEFTASGGTPPYVWSPAAKFHYGDFTLQFDTLAPGGAEHETGLTDADGNTLTIRQSNGSNATVVRQDGVTVATIGTFYAMTGHRIVVEDGVLRVYSNYNGVTPSPNRLVYESSLALSYPYSVTGENSTYVANVSKSGAFGSGVTPTTGATVTFLPVNRNELHTITVRDNNGAGAPVTTTLQVDATLNEISADGFWGDWGFKERKREPATVSVAADGLTQKVRYKGGIVPSWELTPTDRDLIDWKELDAFREFHRLHLPFYIEQPVTLQLLKVVFDQLEYESAFGSHTSISTALLVKKYGGA